MMMIASKSPPWHANGLDVMVQSGKVVRQWARCVNCIDNVSWSGPTQQCNHNGIVNTALSRYIRKVFDPFTQRNGKGKGSTQEEITARAAPRFLIAKARSMSKGKIAIIRILLVDESKSKIWKYTIFVLVKLPLFVDCSGRQRKEGGDCLPCH